MIHRGTFTVVLDACVLYPASVRDILLRLASEDLYRPKWTEEINNEWIRNLLDNREDLNRESLESTIATMNRAFRDAQVTGYQALTEAVTLPDPDDRHVVAAAIRCNADLIVTENLTDFPQDKLAPYDIDIQDPDLFIQNLIDLDLGACCLAFRKQREALNNPPKTREEMRDTLDHAGLEKSAKLLYSNCENN